MSATRAIRHLKNTAAAVPIIALSANVLAQQIETDRVCGMNDHIAKPIDTGELLGKVAWWGQRPGADFLGRANLAIEATSVA